MNFQYSPVYNCDSELAVHCRWIYLFIQFELIAMILEVPSFLLVIYATIKSPFHYNLRFIGLFELSGYYLFLIGRFITCLYEIGALTIIEGEGKPLSLAISSLLQFFYMGCACGISLAIAFERFFATYFVDTYEVQKRKWISILVCAELTFTCGVCSLIMLFDIIPIYIMAFLGVFVSCASFFFYLILFVMNKRRMESFHQERVDDKYTLSVRFQLSENFKVMTLLKNVVIFSGVNNLVMGVILSLYMDKNFQLKYPITSLYLHVAFNLCVIFYSFLMLIIMVFSSKQYRMHFFSLRAVRLLLFPILGRCFKAEFSTNSSPVQPLTVNAETDCYFSNLSSQWDMKYDRVNRTTV